MALNIATTDFTLNPLADLGISITWEDATVSDHPVTGQETISYASGVAKTVVFLKRNTIHEHAMEGEIELADGYIMAQTSEGFAKDDRITYNSRKYLIKSVIRRQWNGIALFDFCELGLVQ